MNFDQRLERAIERGRNVREEQDRQAAARQLTDEELRNLHLSARLDLAERIDVCLRALADRFPGFVFATVAGDAGWGARLSRDDVRIGRGAAENVYSRLELVVRPFSAVRIVELTAKGTVRNREVINRSHFQRLGQLDLASFAELIDLWVLEYAERFAGE